MCADRWRLSPLPLLPPRASHLTGPLEATIASLQREIAAKAEAGQALQRRWIAVQRTLVALQAGNAEAAEAVATMAAQQAVMQQKRGRLHGQ